MCTVMAGHWTVLVVLVTLLESITTNEDMDSEADETKDFLLTKSLGYSIRKNFGKTLDDERLNQKYMYHYNEMIKASQESFESFEDQSDKKLQEQSLTDRRRHSSRLQSAAGIRRSRSQAIRRQKLNSQSLKSHQKHSKQNKITEN